MKKNVKTLVVVLAGGAGGRLELLTRERAKPAVSFAGTHRLIDFPLSNCLHSGLSEVWVVQQFNPISLSDHLANGRPWDLDRTVGGLLTLQPRLGHDDRTGFQQGTSDALSGNAPLIRDFDPEALVVVSADAVYALDYGALVDEHVEADADVTMVIVEVDPEDAGRYGVVQAEDGRVRDYAYKPEDPKGGLVANEVFAFTPGPVLDALEELAGEAGDEGLDDLGDGLLPRLVEAGRAREHRFDGFWRDVGTVPAYWECHQELLGADPPIDLDDPAWPILTHAPTYRPAARLLRNARTRESLVGPGARVGGTVERSVIGRGAVVEAAAERRGPALPPGAAVRGGAGVERSILAAGVEIGRDATVGEPGGKIALV